MKNLVTAFEENRLQRIDLLRIFDNTETLAAHILCSACLVATQGTWPRMFLHGLRPLSIGQGLECWSILRGNLFELIHHDELQRCLDGCEFQTHLLERFKPQLEPCYG
jgi:hypothetical protein